MSLVRCDNCQKRPQVKFNSLYLAWFNDLGERTARRTRLCDSCLKDRVGNFVDPVDPEERLHCPSCHIDTDDDYQGVYGTLYMPGYERELLELPFCTGCKDVFVNWAETMGDALEDRRRADIGPSTHPSGIEVLRSMGIHPRVR